jgi:Zn-dependent membrane protease YugP
MMYIVIVAVFGLLGMLVSSRLKSKFEHYSKVPLSSGNTGADVARAMLQHYGIHDVQIVQGEGFLTDHYNPSTKTVSLSPHVYQGRSVAAAAVAAHECGHAVQHATAYSMLQLRSKMVPVVQIASSLQQFVLMAALGMFGMGGNTTVLLIAVVLFGITALFSVVTLPVEFDASNRALVWLDETGVARGAEYDGAKDALKWAALTYVVAALGAMATFLFFLFKLLGSRE